MLLLDGRVRLRPDSLAFVEARVREGERVWNAHVHVDTSGNPYGAFSNVLVELAWHDYFGDPRTTSYGLEEFDRFPKGTRCFLAPRELLARGARAFRSGYADLRHANDDTPVIRWIAARERIHISPAFACDYRPRAPSARSSGTRFTAGPCSSTGTDGPSRGSSRCRSAFFPVSAALASRRSAGRRSSLRSPLRRSAAAGRGAHDGRQRFETASFAALAPVYAAAHGAGMWRGLAPRAAPPRAAPSRDPRRLRHDGGADQARARPPAPRGPRTPLPPRDDRPAGPADPGLSRAVRAAPARSLARAGCGGRDLRANATSRAGLRRCSLVRAAPRWLRDALLGPGKAARARPRRHDDDGARRRHGPRAPRSVAHIEAGLRSYDLRHPFPEELNRRTASRIARIHYAPGPWAASNLRGGDVVDTGSNTIRDSLALVDDEDAASAGARRAVRGRLAPPLRASLEPAGSSAACSTFSAGGRRTPLVFIDHSVTVAALEGFGLESMFDGSGCVASRGCRSSISSGSRVEPRSS